MIHTCNLHTLVSRFLLAMTLSVINTDPAGQVTELIGFLELLGLGCLQSAAVDPPHRHCGRRNSRWAVELSSTLFPIPVASASLPTTSPADQGMVAKNRDGPGTVPLTASEPSRMYAPILISTQRTTRTRFTIATPAATTRWYSALDDGKLTTGRHASPAV